MPKYKLSQHAFMLCEDGYSRLLKTNTEIDFDGTPGPHMIPLDSEAEARLDAYYKERPGATLRPYENLAPTMGERVTVIALGKEEFVKALSLGEALASKPTPGPTEHGGKVLKVS